MIYLIPYADDARETPFTPWVNYGLIALCVGLFLIETLGPARMAVIGGLIPVRFFDYEPVPDWAAVLPGWSTLLTHILLHAHPMHLAGNMLYLWIFGDNIEHRLGHAAYLAIFLALGAAAGWAHAFVDPLDGRPLIGASGAIAGVLGAYLVCRPRARVHFVVGLLVAYRSFSVPAWVMILAWTLVQGISLSGQTPGDGDNVAYLGHLAGLLAGLPVGAFLRWRARGDTEPQTPAAWPGPDGADGTRPGSAPLPAPTHRHR